MSDTTPELGRDGRRTPSQWTSPAANSGSARLHFPGGRLRPADWSALAKLATDHRSDVHLGARGAVRLRGVQGERSLQDRTGLEGLLPGAASGRAGMIIASPMAGRLEGHQDLGDVPELLDQRVRSRTSVVTLHESFMFGLDSGSGDVLAHSPDLTAVAGPGGGYVRLFVAGQEIGVEASAADAADILIDAAAAFGSRIGHASRIPDSGGEHHLVVVDLQNHPLTYSGAQSAGTDNTDSGSVGAWRSTAVEIPPVGWIDTSDGLVSLLAVVPDGLVSARLAEFLGAVDRPSTISADRVIGLHALTEDMAEQVVRVLAPMGMIFDATSPWVEAVARTDR